MNATTEINENNFEAEVLQATQPVLVDFWAPWCGPCQMLGPVLDEIAIEQAGRAKIAKVNIEQNPALAERYQVQAIPTLLYFAKGEIRERSLGAPGKGAIVAKLQALAAA
jgi:thioredoxin 1